MPKAMQLQGVVELGFEPGLVWRPKPVLHLPALA